MENITFSQDMALELFSSNKEFPVSFEEAWQWLGFSTKGNAKRNFEKAGFFSGIDFEVFISNDKNPIGGRPSEHIYLTIDCFKQWGMMAGTEQGRQIRLYFLECEKIAKKHLQPKTPAELLLYYAEQLLKQEQNLFQIDLHNKEQDLRIHSIEAEQERYGYPNGRFHTVMGFANLQGIRITANDASRKGKLASKLCREQGINVERIHDPRFGKVGMYPESILVEVFKNA